jgi:hypothetical protein
LTSPMFDILAAGPRPSVDLESICQKLTLFFALAQRTRAKRFAIKPSLTPLELPG